MHCDCIKRNSSYSDNKCLHRATVMQYEPLKMLIHHTHNQHRAHIDRVGEQSLLSHLNSLDGGGIQHAVIPVYYSVPPPHTHVHTQLKYPTPPTN